MRTTGSSDLRNQCFLCGKFAAIDLKHPNRTDVHAAKSDKVTAPMLRFCDDRMDDWAFEVKGRILTYGNLHAADAAVVVIVTFSRLCQNVASHQVVPVMKLPQDQWTVIHLLCLIPCAKKVDSADSEVYTVDELMEEMQSLSGNSFDPYSGKYMKRKLQRDMEITFSLLS